MKGSIHPFLSMHMKRYFFLLGLIWFCCVNSQAQKNIEKTWGFETRSILVGQAPDPATGATIFPIYQTSTYTQIGIGENKGYCYLQSQ